MNNMVIIGKKKSEMCRINFLEQETKIKSANIDIFIRVARLGHTAVLGFAIASSRDLTSPLGFTLRYLLLLLTIIIAMIMIIIFKFPA